MQHLYLRTTGASMQIGEFVKLGGNYEEMLGRNSLSFWSNSIKRELVVIKKEIDLSANFANGYSTVLIILKKSAVGESFFQ